MFVNLGYNILGNRNRYLSNPKGECYEPQTFLESFFWSSDIELTLTFLSALWVDEGNV